MSKIEIIILVICVLNLADTIILNLTVLLHHDKMTENMFTMADETARLTIKKLDEIN